jgi:hypothetical protein
MATTAKPQSKTLTDRFLDVLSDFATERGLDSQATFDALARSVNQLDSIYKQRLKDEETAKNKAEFEEAVESRRLEYTLAVANEPYPFRVKRQWIASQKNVVNLHNLSADIFSTEVK